MSGNTHRLVERHSQTDRSPIGPHRFGIEWLSGMLLQYDMKGEFDLKLTGANRRRDEVSLLQRSADEGG